MSIFHILKEQKNYPHLEMDQNTFTKLPEYSMAVPANKQNGFMFKVLLINSQKWFIGRIEDGKIKFYVRRDID